MNEATLKNITAELRDKLVGRKFGAIFVLPHQKLAIDFRLNDGKYLLLSANPSSPRFYLIKRTVKDISTDSAQHLTFADVLRKRLSHATLIGLTKSDGERVVEMEFESRDEAGLDETYTLVIQMTGRSSNIFLLTSGRMIVESMRDTFGEGQSNGQSYAIPPRPGRTTPIEYVAFEKGQFATLSESLDSFYLEKEDADAFRSLSESVKAIVRNELRKHVRLEKKLNKDLQRHGAPQKWKRLGDLIKANIATARRNGEITILTDYFDQNLPEIELEIDKNLSLTEASEKYFKRYSKARNAKVEIEKRLKTISGEIEIIKARAKEVEDAIDAQDTASLQSFLPKKKKRASTGKKSKTTDISKYVREYTSSDGIKILVGKRSKDNDFLTFRIAKSLDIWLHAADYPGSHVVIRRHGKGEIPQTTLLEAARLAAFYSKAKNEAKAAVRFTEKKFVNKPKGAAPGLVSLASSKTLMVRPGIPEFETE